MKDINYLQIHVACLGFIFTGVISKVNNIDYRCAFLMFLAPFCQIIVILYCECICGYCVYNWAQFIPLGDMLHPVSNYNLTHKIYTYM